MPTRQFLVSVEPSPEGYEATVQSIVRSFSWLPDSLGESFTGQGATEVAACLAALTQAKLDEGAPNPEGRLPS